MFIGLGPSGPAPLTPSGLTHMIRDLGKAAGITNVRCSTHTLRHTFAVFYLVNGGDPASLQLLLGHTTLKMTMSYLHLNGTQLATLQNQFSPATRIDTAAITRYRRATTQEGDPTPAQLARAAARQCQVEGCGRPARARGWCDAHLKRWEQKGDVQADIPVRPHTPKARNCVTCGTTISEERLRTHPNQRFCSNQCFQMHCKSGSRSKAQE